MTAPSEELRIVEAFLFASPQPVSEEEIAGRLPEGTDIKALLVELAEHYQGRGVEPVKTAERWSFRTAADMAPKLKIRLKQSRRMSRAALETLAIIAYHQPVTRAEIEEIRGVSLSKGTLDLLLEIGWIRPSGRRKVPGKPLQWRTSDGFLEHFGLDRVDDLPGKEEMKAAGLLDRRPDLPPIGLLKDHLGADAAADGEEGDDEGAEGLDEEA
ncbi:MAG: SMC-Scp complex subunit ScpB [Proteobacteria bacterium]|jgi:segregation and condensation protein B|nr:SMC-Scp complex subunit ScpB [Pseudomonadota bacterium]MDA1070995.1 SMC-Scp complex subunit ScpB [Pseudomonadota bacterium]